jgi:hypothetical protein
MVGGSGAGGCVDVWMELRMICRIALMMTNTNTSGGRSGLREREHSTASLSSSSFFRHFIHALLLYQLCCAHSTLAADRDSPEAPKLLTGKERN